MSQKTDPKAIIGTETEKVLLQSYFAESAAYSRYTFYAAQADKELFFPVGEVFRETAANELRHAKVFFKYLPGGKPLQVNVATNPGEIATTLENLETAAAEELSEGVDFYLAAAMTARLEHFEDIAAHFEAIAKIEKNHHDRFMRYAEHIKNNTLWRRDKPVTWQCLVCGYVVEGLTPPEVCPACDHPYQHYIALEDIAL
jgi:rubrerythrin